MGLKLSRKSSFSLILFLNFSTMPALPNDVTYGQWLAVYNALSFGIAAMGAATIFFWIEIGNVHKKYRVALSITGLVTAIACYHYVRIFNSWNEAFGVTSLNSTGVPFDDGEFRV